MDKLLTTNFFLWIGIFIIVAALLQVLLFLYVSLRNTYASRNQNLISVELLRKKVERETLNVQLDYDKSVNGWTGIRKFSLSDKVLESNDICSFYLKPHDGKSLPPFEAGQYLTFKLKLPDRDKPLVRCYSLSDSPLERDHYRVSIKRLDPPPSAQDAPPGQSSNYFHQQLEQGDVLDVKAPSGNFYLDQTQHTPVVLIGGGIGITPVLSMLGAICDAESKRETWLFYGVRNGEEHIMQDYLKQADAANENVNVRVCYSNPRACEGYLFQTSESESQDNEPLKINELLSIGRDSDNDLALADEKVSRKHACIRQANGEFTVTDLGSANGVFVNGSLINEAVVLRDKDEMTVGSHTLVFHLYEDIRDKDYDFDERVSVELFKRLLPSNNYDFFICGPPPMMESIVNDLKDWGVPTSKIHFEAFGPASIKASSDKKAEPSAGDDTSIDVVFAKSGKTAQWNAGAGSILDLAEANAIDMDFGCRAGSCGTCMTAVHSGEFEYLDDPSTEADEGTCLACIAIPKSVITVDA